MNRIKYFVSYDTVDNKSENRIYVPAATSKIDYIVEILNRNGYAVDLVSISQTANNSLYRGSLKKIGINTLQLFPTTPRGGIVKKTINQIVMRIAILCYMISNIKEHEVVMIYHSVATMWIFRFLKYCKKCKIIEEVEELYGDVYDSAKLKRKEIRTVSKADAFIIPTFKLDSVVNFNNKLSVLIHGIYRPERKIANTRNDGVIHCVYAGTLDPRKGSIEAVESAEYLDERYYIHILGFGSKDQIDNLCGVIDRVQKLTTCKVSYDGYLQGDDFLKSIQSCHIGLVTQKIDADYNDTSFPSKIMMYLCNGLQVVCVNIPAVNESVIASNIVFCESDSAVSIAQAIKSINPDENQEIELIKELDEDFSDNISSVLKVLSQR